MADTAVDSATFGFIGQGDGVWGPYWSSPSIGVIVYSDATQTSYARTTDGGANWSAGNAILDLPSVQLKCWYDKENPGVTTTLVHVLSMDAGTDTTEEVRYRTVDVATATLGTERVIESSLTIGSTVQSICGITVAESGRIYVTWSTQSAISAYYSDDAGANWNSIASPLETATQEDFILLFPANGTGDDDDCCCIFHDKSADEISLKMYDASGDSWTETSIETSVPDNSQFRQFDGTVRHSDGHIILVYVDTDAFDCVDLNPNSIASPGVTALTSVGTSITGPHSVGILINQQNNDIYASYMRGTVGSALSVYYKLSDDDGATWETEAAMSEDTAENLHGMGSGRTVGSAGGRWQPVWFDSDDADIFINLTNDVEIAAVVAQSNAPRSLYYHLVGGGR